MRKSLGVLIFLSAFASGAFPQDLFTLDLGDPLYRIVEICEIRGMIPPISAVKPYGIGEIRRSVETALENTTLMSEDEAAILTGLRIGCLDKEASVARIDAWAGSDLRFNLPDFQSVNSVNSVHANIRGNLGAMAAYGVDVGIFLDKVDPDAFPPFSFTKTWDSTHIWYDSSTGITVSNGVTDHFSESSSAASELTVGLLDDMITLRLGRSRREWGLGDGSLSLSGTARPTEGLYGCIAPFPWAQFHFLSSSLGSWWNAFGEQKMLSIHSLEISPLDWLYLSVWESSIWAKRMEPLYLNPLMPYFIDQQIIGDLDNIAMGGDVGITLHPFVRLYASVFIDEIAIFPLEDFFTRAENQYAWQVGAKLPVPWPAWSMFTAQYTKIEPYCYTHYPQTLPQYASPVDIGYSNDNENLGYHLPPNSDELLVRFSTHPVSGLEGSLQFQLIRHGTGDHLLGQIEGDMNIPIIYNPPTTYPSKNFLFDGVYEWINIIRVGLSYTYAPWNVTAWAEYCYVNGLNYDNVVGNNVIENLLGIGVKLRITAWDAR
jgi:hypothetical protein